MDVNVWEVLEVFWKLLHLPKDPSSHGGHARYGSCHACEGMLGNGGEAEGSVWSWC